MKCKLYSLLGIAFLLFTLQSFGQQDLKAWQIYDKTGNPVSFNTMISDFQDADVVLFGELHNNSIIHWLELQTLKSLDAQLGHRLVVGAEMLERDNQEAVNQFLTEVIQLPADTGTNSDKMGFEQDEDEIRYQHLEDSARLWPNFKNDYLPLLEFARVKNLKFVATNVPRRYAQMVAKSGIDTLMQLSKADKKWITSLPISVDMATPGYKEMEAMMGSHAGDRMANFIAAQALKDATMAESIRKSKKRKQLFLHFNGDYHSKAYGGIYWYLHKAKPNWKIKVISIVEAEDSELPLPEMTTPTDFIIVVPKDMIKSY